jgi:AraC-like DNA-binding protein
MTQTWTDVFSHHLPPAPADLHWGLRVIHAGFAEVPPGTPYPLPQEGLKRLPSYRMPWQRGRTMQEYQVLYISRGRGVFESEPTGQVRIEAGTAFMIFPGVWHRYRPLPKVGWSESYVGFDGWYADRLVKALFTPERAVLRIGVHQDLLLLLHSMKDLMAAAPSGYRQILVVRTLEVLARVRALAEVNREDDRERHARIEEARRRLIDGAEENLDLERLARELGMCYTQFRLFFRRQTGLSPRQFQIDIRINKAKDLLRHTELSVQELAEHLGFSSAFYFSQQFKKKTGLSPLAWRKGGAAEGGGEPGAGSRHSGVAGQRSLIRTRSRTRTRYPQPVHTPSCT